MSSGSNATPAISIGFALAQNLIGGSGTGNSVGVEAYTEGSSLTADQGISLSADSTATISATVDATSVAVAASTSSTAVGVSAAGVSTDNEVYLTIYAGVDGGTGVLARQGNISVTASDASTITSDAQAVSVTADLSARRHCGRRFRRPVPGDEHHRQQRAGVYHECRARQRLPRAPWVSSATENSTIPTPRRRPPSLIGASSSGTGLALSGGGSMATNVILGSGRLRDSTNLDRLGRPA